MVVRARLTMGNGLPKGVWPAERFPRHSADEGGKSEAETRPREAEAQPHRFLTVVGTCHGQHVLTVERMLTLRKQQVYETTVDKAALLVDALKDLAGD